MKIAHIHAVMKPETRLNTTDSPSGSKERKDESSEVQDVLGWLLFIRHYGGHLRKYGGASATKRAAQT